MHVLLTGATGFVGSAIVDSLNNKGNNLRVLVRKKSNKFSDLIDQQACDLEDLNYLPSKVFLKIECVVHCAARVHVINESSPKNFDEYRKFNRDVTLNLAKLAAKHGVKRFVYLSTIKVNGERTLLGRRFKPEDGPAPENPYGISKFEAEKGLLKLATETGMDVVIIRPPLVYGPNVKANFLKMINWVKAGIPLPFSMINNNRSIIAIDNLVDFILLCADRVRSPNAANQVFLVSDGEDVSTSTLLKKVAKAYGFKSRLFPMPVLLMKLFAELIGKSDLADRLFGDLQVDSSKAHQLLGWKPLITVDEQLRKMAELDIRDKNL